MKHLESAIKLSVIMDRFNKMITETIVEQVLTYLEDEKRFFESILFDGWCYREGDTIVLVRNDGTIHLSPKDDTPLDLGGTLNIRTLTIWNPEKTGFKNFRYRVISKPESAVLL